MCQVGNKGAVPTENEGAAQEQRDQPRNKQGNEALHEWLVYLLEQGEQ